MKSIHVKKKSKFTLIWIALGVLLGDIPFSVEAVEIDNFDSEKKDRLTDQVALDSQRKAESSFLKLLKKYSGTTQEPVIRMKLAETYQNMASLYFRILHGGISPSKGESKNQYHKSLKNEIEQLNLILKKYPKFEEADLATFMLGKAFEELGDKKNAKSYYQALLKNFPVTDFTLKALISLSDFATEENHHEESLSYIHKIEEYPESPQYPFALYKGAWNYYNIKNIPYAIRYLERHLEYYKKKLTGTDVASSDKAILENTLLDLSLFFFEGYEMRLQRFGLSDAYPYFKKHENGSTLGKMLLRFAKLLRAHNHSDDLIAFKKILIQNEKKLPETLDVIALHFEHELNKHQYMVIGDIALDIVNLLKESPELKQTESYKKAETLVIQTADRLQKLIVKNKKATEVKMLSQSLARLYDSFTKMVTDQDPRVAQAHYNLAETLFLIEDYLGAAEHYRWVIYHTPDRSLPEYGNSLIRAVASRYEVLKLEKLIPEKLEVSTKIENTSQPLPPLMAEWLEWLKESKTRMKKVDDTFLAFEFDAYRAIYNYGHVERAIQSLLKFIQEYPQSRFYTPSASLVLDTYIKAELWMNALEFSDEQIVRKTSADSSFKEKLAKISADIYFKIIEIESNKENWEAVSKLSNRCTKKYKHTERYSDCLLKGAIAHLRQNEVEKAMPLFESLIQNDPNSDAARLGLIERAQILENEGLLLQAIEDYQAYLNHPGSSNVDKNKKLELEERIVTLAWIAGKHALVEKLIQSCPTNYCKDFDLRLLVVNPNYKASVSDTIWIQNALKAPKEQRSLYALVAFQRAKKIPLRDRLNLVETIAKTWERMDFAIQTEFYPVFRDEIQKILLSCRHEINLYAKIDPSRPASIKNRISWVKDFEKVTTDLVQIHLPELKVIGLKEAAEVYRDFARAIRGGTKSDDEVSKEINEIAFPFEEKANELLSKSFEIAARDAVDPVVFEKIATLFFDENPSQKKALLPPSHLNTSGGFFQIDHLKALNLEGMKKDPLFNQWMDSLQPKKVALNLYFLKRLEKKYEKHLDFPLVKALSWQNTGLRSQAILEIQSFKKFDPIRLQIWAYLGAKPSIEKLLSERTKADWENSPAQWVLTWVNPIENWIHPPVPKVNREVATDTSLENQKKTE